MKNITRTTEFTLQMNLVWEPRFDTNDVNLLNIRIHTGERGHSQLTISKMTTLLTMWWRKTKNVAKRGTNVIKLISSKILRSETLKLTALKKPLEFDLICQSTTPFESVPQYKVLLCNGEQWFLDGLTPLVCITPG